MCFIAGTDAWNCDNPVDCCDDGDCNRDADNVGQFDWRTGRWCHPLHGEPCDVVEQPIEPVEG